MIRYQGNSEHGCYLCLVDHPGQTCDLGVKYENRSNKPVKRVGHGKTRQKVRSLKRSGKARVKQHAVGWRSGCY